MDSKQKIVVGLGLGLVLYLFWTSSQKNLVLSLLSLGNTQSPLAPGTTLPAYKNSAGNPLTGYGAAQNKKFKNNPVAQGRFGMMSNPNGG